MNVLVTGSSGFFGTHLVRFLCTDEGVTVFTLDRTEYGENNQIAASFFFGDSLEAIPGLLQEMSFDLIVHSAAMSSFPGCEENPDIAYKANVDYTRILVEKSKKDNAQFIFISTDLVFDGNETSLERRFTESDIPTPNAVYAKTKKKAEELVLQELPNSGLVLRSCLLYGALAGRGGGPLRWIMNALENEEVLPLFYDEWRTPLWTEDLSRIVFISGKKKLSGLYHCAGNERLNRVEFAQVVADNSSKTLHHNEVSRHDVIGPPRPADVSLDNSAICNLLDFQFTPLAVGLRVALTT